MKRRKVAAIGCGVAVVLVLAIGLLNYGMFGRQSYYAADVPEHDLAPSSATSIEVFEARNMSGVASVTYRVNEEAFRKFAAEKGWPLSSGSGSIHFHVPSNYFGPVHTREDLESYLFYERRQSNGGGITVYYIPAESRVYIDKSNR